MIETFLVTIEMLKFYSQNHKVAKSNNLKLCGSAPLRDYT